MELTDSAVNDVQHQRNNNGKRLGGITGKGFKPGQSGNPGGRPKGESLLAEIRDLLHGGGGKNRREVAEAFLGQLKRGSLPHAKEIIEREEGAVPTDGKLVVEVEFVRRDPQESPN